MSKQFDDRLVEVERDLIGVLLVCISVQECMCFVRSVSLICVIFWLLQHSMVRCWPT